MLGRKESAVIEKPGSGAEEKYFRSGRLGKTSLRTEHFELKKRKEPVRPRAVGRLKVGAGSKARKCLFMKAAVTEMLYKSWGGVKTLEK